MEPHRLSRKVPSSRLRITAFRTKLKETVNYLFNNHTAGGTAGDGCGSTDIQDNLRMLWELVWISNNGSH